MQDWRDGQVCYLIPFDGAHPRGSVTDLRPASMLTEPHLT
jgi:hypothetical protein